MTGTPPSASPTVIRLARYTHTEQSEILGGGPDPFGVAETGLTWLPKDEHFAIRQNGRLVAHAGLLRIPVSLGGEETHAMGLGGVAVAPDSRGQGLARLVVTAAVEHARTQGPRYGLLFCRPPLVPLYQRLGWRTVDGDVHVDQPTGPVVMPLRTMWTPLGEGAERLVEPVRLLSLPM
ncbi:GNAT family N-acetyltransferase [Streptomyces piniterrae]|uniref:GNAT family N-acetyltransferase n=1 Tax=Streptomyces piniterrae TaxID=2571125 RepID=A0A4U0NJW7_9ACTN|nr:GNAT family N-acetyltransferase [Streptomyces piniterrae]TJZ54619.1 GNAT family N-acetyltransferase [Streptomyces piniterrae]